MNIMFDMDGVLADFISGFTLIAAGRFGTPVTHTVDQPKWDGFPGLNHRQINATWDLIKESTDFWSGLGTMIGTKTMWRINALQEKHRVYFVTSRSQGLYTHHQTTSWLKARGIGDPQVIIVPSAASKGNIAAGLEAHYAIDDKAGNAVYVGYHVPGVRSYIINRPYNQFDAEVIGSKVKRIDRVSQYLDDIDAREDTK